MSRKDRRTIIVYARALGIRDASIEQRGRHPHLVGTRPNGTALRYVLAGSPSDKRRGRRNAQADLRRACRRNAGAGGAAATQHSAVEGGRTAAKPSGTPGTGRVTRARPRRCAPAAAPRQIEGAGDGCGGGTTGPALPFATPAVQPNR